MKVIVKGKVPTVYQLNALSTLTGGEYHKLPGNGGFFFEKKFATKKDAKEFLKGRAHALLLSDAFDTKQYKAAIASINRRGSFGCGFGYDGASLMIFADPLYY